jgi:hypothetical protein
MVGGLVGRGGRVSLLSLREEVEKQLNMVRWVRCGVDMVVRWW